MSKQILILGGGYGGLLTALTARQYLTPEEATITVVNRYPTHQIITELHRLAAGSIAEQAVALPLEKLLRGKDVNLKIDTVDTIKPDEKKVLMTSGSTYSYDALVVALGSETASSEFRDCRSIASRSNRLAMRTVFVHTLKHVWMLTNNPATKQTLRLLLAAAV